MNRAPYSGQRETIAIAIDVGTTYSGATYAILRPGEIPLVQGVTRFVNAHMFVTAGYRSRIFVLV